MIFSLQAQSTYGYRTKRSLDLVVFGVDAGFITRNTFNQQDFNVEYFSPGYGVTARFPVLNRVSLGMFFRAGGGDLSGWNTFQNGRNTYYKVHEPIDFGGTMTFSLYNSISRELSLTGGAGSVFIATSYVNPEGVRLRQRGKFELILPLEVLYTEKIAEQVSVGLGYRYYLTFTDDMDATYAHQNNDRFAYLFAGIYFHYPRALKRYCPRPLQ